MNQADADFSDKLKKLKELVWAKRPILGEIIDTHKDMTLMDYALDFLDVNDSKVYSNRREEALEVVNEILTERLGSEVAGGVVAQLRDLPLVSTAEHHALIMHPFWLNSCIISSAPLKMAGTVERNFHVVLSFASVSVNNSSGYPRGLIFHGGVGDDHTIRLPIFPDKYKMSTVYAMRPYDREDLQKCADELDKKVKDNLIEGKRGSKIKEFILEFLGQEKFIKAPDMNSQLTEINYNLWPLMFKGREEKAMINPPDLIFFEIETLVAKILLAHHLSKSESLLHRLLFDNQLRDLSLKHFDGLYGAFSLADDTGTFMFWGLDEKKRRVGLNYDQKNNLLVSKDGGLKIEFTPEGIRQALHDQQIFPSMLLCYVVISLYYGFKCLGGFCQVHDLTVIKMAWQEILEADHNLTEAQTVKIVQTREFGGDGLILVYYHKANKLSAPASGLDLYLQGRVVDYGNFLHLAQELRLGDLMESMMPDIYAVLYASYERDNDLADIRPEQILRSNGLIEKIEQANSTSTMSS